jgi:pimeloyl-ACP methyl ester carboxylesterase
VKSWSPPRVPDPAPLFLFHDSLGCVELWRDFPRLLSTGLARVVVAYDRLGYGRSSERMDPPSADFIAEEARDFFPAVLRSSAGSASTCSGTASAAGWPSPAPG